MYLYPVVSPINITLKGSEVDGDMWWDFTRAHQTVPTKAVDYCLIKQYVYHSHRVPLTRCSPIQLPSTPSLPNLSLKLHPLHAILDTEQPTSGTATAPYSKGKRVADYLDMLERHAGSARIPHSHLLGYVLCYCVMKVRVVSEGSSVWTGDDWLRKYLLRTFIVPTSNDRNR